MFIELDDGKIYRKDLYLMVKTMVSGSDFPLNQSIEMWPFFPKNGEGSTFIAFDKFFFFFSSV